MVVAGCLHAGRVRRKEDAEICEDNPAYGQAMGNVERARLPISPAKSAVGHLEDASLTYLGYVRLCWLNPWAREMYCQIPGKEVEKGRVWRKKDTTQLK